MSSIGRNLVLVLAVAGGVYLGLTAVGFSEQQVAKALPISPIESPEDLSIAFRAVSERILPAVVSIRTESDGREITVNDQGRRGRRGQVPFRNGVPQDSSPFEEEFFKQFFGPNFNMDDLREQMDQRRMMTPPSEGTGSGFIVESSGMVLTNSHVVQDADHVYIQLHDGRELKATSWDYDPRTDIAIVKIEAGEPLPALVLGDSDAMRIGDWVIAAGNPLGVGTSITSGIISADARRISNDPSRRENYLQTDAAINPGNSGGPLVNLHGEVIGINTAISTRSGGYDGIGFAVPSNMARWVAEQLMSTGTVKRSYLGVSLQMLSNDVRNQLQIPAGQGTVVTGVKEGTPAAKAGIEIGDVIVGYNNQVVANTEQLIDLVEKSTPEKSYEVKVIREGKEVVLNVVAESMPTDYIPSLAQRAEREEPEAESDPQEPVVDAHGMQLMDLTGEIRDQLQLGEDVDGPVVKEVTPRSAAAHAGIQPGDVIEKVGTTKVGDLAEFEAALAKMDAEKDILLFVRSQGGGRFVVLKPVK